MEILLTTIVFFLIITIIIVVHEFGHFITAKKFGVDVQEFSVGMGPLAYKRHWRGTQYSIRWLPIGGYVKMLGEGETVNKKGSFSLLKPWKRLIIIYAGVMMNFVLVALIFTALAIKNNGQFYGVSIQDGYTYPFGDSHVSKQGIAGVEENSPAQKAGLQTLDIITKINDKDYTSFPDYSKEIGANLGKEVKLEVTAYLSGDVKNVTLTPRDPVAAKLSGNQTATGIVRGPYFVRADFSGWALPFAGILQTANSTHNYISTLGYIVGQAFEQHDITIVSDNLSSPVGVYSVTQKVISLNGFWGIINLMGILSLAIGIMNAVPFPALDGWHGVFILGEWITRKKVNEKLYNIVTTGGFVLLLALGVFLMIKDALNFNRLFG